MNAGTRAQHLWRFVTFGVLIICVALGLATTIARPLDGFVPACTAVSCGITAVIALLLQQHLPGPAPVQDRVRDLFLLTLLLVVFCVSNILLNQGRATGGVVWFTLLVALSWVVARGYGNYLIGIDQPSHRRDSVPRLNSLMPWFLAGGVLLFLVAGLAPRSGPGVRLALVVYLLLGIVVLAQLQDTERRRQWRDRGMIIHRLADRNWLPFALGFLAAGAAIGALVPTKPAIVIVDAASSRLILPALAWLGTGVIGLLERTQYGIFEGPPRIRAVRVGQRSNSGEADAVYGGKPHHGSAPPSGWHASLVMIGMLVVLGYLSYAYLRHRKGGVALRIALLEPFLAVWDILRLMLGQSLGSVFWRVPADFRMQMETIRIAARPLRLLRIRALSPREQVIFYYLTLIRGAQRRGFPRRGSETPGEYGALLATRLGDARLDIRLVTEAFVEARYSAHDIQATQVGRVRASCRRVGTVLRKADQRSGVGERAPATCGDGAPSARTRSR